MSLAPVDVSNIALARIGARSIATMTENSVEARACNRLFAWSRDLMLSTRDWKFAKTRSNLVAAAGATAIYPWQAVYLRPDGCLRPRFVTVAADAQNGMSNDDRDPFEEGIAMIAGVATPIIFTNVSPAILCYTGQITDPSLWEPGFVSAMSLQLAAEIAGPITGSMSMSQALRQAAADAVAMSNVDNMNEGVSQQQRGAESVAVRGR